jgi:hypothetical protein
VHALPVSVIVKHELLEDMKKAILRWPFLLKLSLAQTSAGLSCEFTCVQK